MKPLFAAFGAGLLFGLGLGLSGMTLPAKVTAFLDITGAWDPSLAFVMVGAIGVHFVLFRVVTKRVGPLFGGLFQIPRRSDIDLPLVLGAALFGIGWGLGGYCPGPGLASLATLGWPALLFVAAMTAGMKLQSMTAGLFHSAENDIHHGASPEAHSERA